MGNEGFLNSAYSVILYVPAGNIGLFLVWLVWLSLSCSRYQIRQLLTQRRNHVYPLCNDFSFPLYLQVNVKLYRKV